MNTRTKEILRTSIILYEALPGKEEIISQLKEHLKIHYNGINTIGVGLDEDKVRAGEIFLRIVKNKQ